jgi:hypothetical protein
MGKNGPTEEGKKELTREEEILLVEYQAAQSSAEHHDTLVWTVTSIIWAGNLVLLGLVLNVIDKTELKCLISIFSAVGILLCVSVWIFAGQFRKIKLSKYKRCVEIEKILNHMEQHSREMKPPRKQKSKVCRFIKKIFEKIFGIILGIKQWIIYLLIMAVFIFLWMQIIFFV